MARCTFADLECIGKCFTEENECAVGSGTDSKELDACYTTFIDCLPCNSRDCPNEEIHSSYEAHVAHVKTTTDLHNEGYGPTATTDIDLQHCVDDYRSCLDNAPTWDDKLACRSRFRACLGPPGGAAVTFNDEISSSHEVHDDTTIDLNNEGADVMADVTQEVHRFHKYSCIEILQRCLAAATDNNGVFACNAAYNQCSRPRVAVTFNKENHHNIHEVHDDTTISDLNNEGYGLRGNLLKNY